MDLRDYQTNPDEQLFDKIQHRLKVRRLRRIVTTACAAAVCVAATAVAITRFSASNEQGTESVNMGQNNIAATTEVPVTVTAPSTTAPYAETAEQETVVASGKQTPSNDENLEELLPVGTAAPQPVAEPADCSPTTVHNGKIATIPAMRQHEKKKEEVAMTVSGEQGLRTEERRVENHAKNVATAVSPLWAPNAIVPDGDDDENRCFKLVSASPITEFTVRIFNRRGLQVFTSNNPNFCWDGSYNGERVSQGAYIWTVKYRDSDGHVQQQRGSVVVVR